MEINLNNVLQRCFDSLEEGLSPKKPYHFPVVGTINQNCVELRTMVLRDFILNKNELVFYTDYRSPKINQINKVDQVSILFYDGDKMEQLRIVGKPTIHHDDEITVKYWNKINPSKRRDYASKVAPSSLANDAKDYLDKDWLKQTNSYYENFAVIITEILEMDWLLLEKEGNKRARFLKKESGFKMEWLVP